MENLLPADIKLEIFSRLPAESVLQCRQVCKTWRTLLRHPHFAQMHLQRQLMQPDNLGILCLDGNFCDYSSELYYGEYDENDEQSYKTLARINNPPIQLGEQVFSCNGLIGFSTSNDNSFYICNPVTREYVNLPALLNTDFRKNIDRRIVYGFGYLPSTNEYKVVGILYRHISKWVGSVQVYNKWVGSVQVYTLGAGTGWRNKGEITDLQSSYFVDANGCLYFLDNEKPKIVAFDLADEEFRLLPSPPLQTQDEDDFFCVRVLGGLLCLVHENHGKGTNIWSLKKNNCTAYVMKEHENKSWSWHKEVCMTSEGLKSLDTSHFNVFAITRKGEVLLWLYGRNRSGNNVFGLSRYDPKTATFKKSDMDMSFLEVALHMNSFVSLKALGEDAKIIPSAE